MFVFVLKHDVGGHSISGSHSVSKQNDRGSEYFEIERPGGQKLGGSFDFVTLAAVLPPFLLLYRREAARRIYTVSYKKGPRRF